ncbi:hypothetical protein ACQ4PT_069556 [Festuca glaucescens]
MSSSIAGKDVEIEGRFVHLEVGANGQKEKSNPFYVGWWKWQISVIRAGKRTLVTLWPCSNWDRIAASVSLKLTFFPKSRPVVLQKLPEVVAPLSRNYTWSVKDGCVSTSCLVEIEFVSVTKFGSTESAVLSLPMQRTSEQQAQSGVTRMLQKGILTDITVNAVGGSIRAHRAVLAARSPVFLSMFSHALQEKELSTVDISDMSIVACRAFVGYIYGASVSEEELLAHRSELVAAGDKYCIADLKKTCEESLGKDVGTENVLQMLQMAHTYSLPVLKRTCIRLLVDFGKMYEIPEDFLEFTGNSDPELVDEIKRFAFSRGRKFPAATRRESAAGKVSAKKARLPSVRKSTTRQASGSPAKRARKAIPSQASASIPAIRHRRSTVWKPTPGQDSDALPDKRARRANVRLTGDEWALPGSRGTR